jgi:uncharacterized membrane protein YeaQ/YmgE (transglycosylase-associated protein family)
MVSVFFWAAFGSVIGWVAAILQDETAPRRIIGYVLTGTMGGLAGGFGGLLLSPSELAGRANTTDIMFAMFGATAFVFIAGLASQKRSRG